MWLCCPGNIMKERELIKLINSQTEREKLNFINLTYSISPYYLSPHTQTFREKYGFGLPSLIQNFLSPRTKILSHYVLQLFNLILTLRLQEPKL